VRADGLQKQLAAEVMSRSREEDRLKAEHEREVRVTTKRRYSAENGNPKF
jgi:hypothetical protein